MEQVPPDKHIASVELTLPYFIYELKIKNKSFSNAFIL